MRETPKLVDQSSTSGSGDVAESYPAVPESVPRARQAVVGLAAQAGASEAEIDAIRLATSEALTNAVLHAYDGAPGLVHVRAALAAGALSVIIGDDGAGLRPRVDRLGMGLGLTLIAEATEELAIVKRPGGGVELHMRFPVGADS
jgi:serine/threonine-protein kinase RsbW